MRNTRLTHLHSAKQAAKLAHKWPNRRASYSLHFNSTTIMGREENSRYKNMEALAGCLHHITGRVPAMLPPVHQAERIRIRVYCESLYSIYHQTRPKDIASVVEMLDSGPFCSFIIHYIHLMLRLNFSTTGIRPPMCLASMILPLICCTVHTMLEWRVLVLLFLVLVLLLIRGRGVEGLLRNVSW